LIRLRKNLNFSMGFVNLHSMINQNSLGHCQSWRFKKQKSITIMTNNFDQFSLILYFYICALLSILKLRIC
jgi:hypothetical protein